MTRLAYWVGTKGIHFFGWIQDWAWERKYPLPSRGLRRKR